MCKETIEVASSIVLALTAVGGLAVAFFGLRTWKAQLKGTAEYDLARRYLRAVYRVRDALRTVRVPWMLPEELSAAADLLEKSKRDDHDAQIGAAYQKRWQTVVDASRELDVEKLEAEVLWGERAKDIFLSLRKVTGEIYAIVDRAVQDPEWRRSSDAHDKLYARVGAVEKDEIDQQLTQAVEEIEEFVQPFLKK